LKLCSNKQQKRRDKRTDAGHVSIYSLTVF